VRNKNKLNQMLRGTGIQSSQLLAQIEFIDDTIADTEPEVKPLSLATPEEGAERGCVKMAG